MKKFNDLMGTHIWEQLAEIPPNTNPVTAQQEFEPADIDESEPVSLKEGELKWASHPNESIEQSEGGYLLPDDPINGDLFNLSLDEVAKEDLFSVLSILAYIHIDDKLSRGMTQKLAVMDACRVFPAVMQTPRNFERVRQLWIHAKRKQSGDASI